MDFQLRGVEELKPQMFVENTWLVEDSKRLACLGQGFKLENRESKVVGQVA